MKAKKATPQKAKPIPIKVAPPKEQPKAVAPKAVTIPKAAPKVIAEPEPSKDMDNVFKRLKTVLRGYANKLRIAKNDQEAYELCCKKTAPNGAALYFGGVHFGKRHVSYHLFPVYVVPKLLEGMSPKLKKRMQGKSTFNFEEMDETLIEELAVLTQKGFDTFEARGMI